VVTPPSHFTHDKWLKVRLIGLRGDKNTYADLRYSKYQKPQYVNIQLYDGKHIDKIYDTSGNTGWVCVWLFYDFRLELGKGENIFIKSSLITDRKLAY
jgi:hypothetical protein